MYSYTMLTSEALRYGSHSFTLQTHHTCLHLVSVHLTAPQKKYGVSVLPETGNSHYSSE